MYPTPSVSARRYFLDGLAIGQLRYQFDPATGKAIFYPREVAPSARLGPLEWRVSEGVGQIYSFTEVCKREGAYNIVLVDLAEGFRVMSSVPDAPAGSLQIGLAVRARVDQSDDGPRLVFEVIA